MDIDDENENNDGIFSSETNSVVSQLNTIQSGNQMQQMYNQPHTNTLPQDLNTALNMIFPCSETSAVPSINSSINPEVHNTLIHHPFNVTYDLVNNVNILPEKKKKKNAPSQRKRRHMKKIMEKEEFNKDNDEDDEDDDDDDDDNKLKIPTIQGPKEKYLRKSNSNESEGDELAMLGIDAEDMAAQYY